MRCFSSFLSVRTSASCLSSFTIQTNTKWAPSLVHSLFLSLQLLVFFPNSWRNYVCPIWIFVFPLGACSKSFCWGRRWLNVSGICFRHCLWPSLLSVNGKFATNVFFLLSNVFEILWFSKHLTINGLSRLQRALLKVKNALVGSRRKLEKYWETRSVLAEHAISHTEAYSILK